MRQGKTDKAPPLTLAFDMAGDDPARVEVTFRLGPKTQRRIFFQSNGLPLRKSGDVLLCLGLAPAMELGADLVVEGAVSRELLDNAAKVQSLLCEWFKDFREIAIQADLTNPVYPADRGAGVFFSGGVDSSHSLKELHREIDALVTVIGADVHLAETDRVERLVAATKDLSGHYGLEPITITTDIRHVSDRLVGWVEYHGAFLAAVHHLLADRLQTQHIASSGSSRILDIPWGSHPSLDPLYGTEGARIVHHSLLDRFSKLGTIVDEPALMRHLRVCPRSDPNCGSCRKCGFVLHSLAALDTLHKAPTFDGGKLHGAPITAYDDDNEHLMRLRDAAAKRDPGGETVRKIDRTLRIYAAKRHLARFLPTQEWLRRFKRFKRQHRYRKAASP